MNFKKLGNTGIKVSSICLGTMTWGEQNTQKDAFEQMDYTADQGINFFDTAEIYPSPCFEKTYASTEKIIGDWFKQKKIAIKLFWHLKLLDQVYHGYVMEDHNIVNRTLKKQ